MSWGPEVRRGDVVLVNLDLVVGREIGRRRPAMVVQNDVGNEHSPTVIVATVTSWTKRKERFPVCVTVPTGAGGLDRRSIVNAAQVRTVDRVRLVGPPLGRLPTAVMREVDEALRVSLALS